jgi:hypothetical protein
MNRGICFGEKNPGVQPPQETGGCLDARLIKFNPIPLPIIRNAPTKKFQVTLSLKMRKPAIPVNTISDIKIKDPSEALQNLNP